VTIPTTIPHEDFGDPTCCGCLSGDVHGDVAVISCNECGTIVQTVPTSELQRTLDEMQAGMDLAAERGQVCDAVNVMPGFERVIAFVCDRCGKSNVVAES
jgi:hypothetical protein